MEDKLEADKSGKRLFRRPSVVIKARNNKDPKEVRGPSDGEKTIVWRTTFLKISEFND